MSDPDFDAQVPHPRVDDDSASTVAVAERGASDRARPLTMSLTELAAQESRPARRSRHAAPDDGADTALVADPDDLAEFDDEPRGRHGRAASGLSVAEIMARLDSAATSTGLSTQAQSASTLSGALSTVGDAVEDLLQPEPLVLDPARPHPRAGRNLPAAIAVGLSLGALIVATLLAYRPSFVVIVVLAVAMGTYELVHAVATVEARAPLVPLVAGGAAMDIAAWHSGPDGLVGALLLTVVGVAIWRLADGAPGYRQDVAAGNLVALYVPFLAGFAILLAQPSDGAARVMLFVAAVVCSDTGGYIAGVLVGKHPMVPAVSPKKSWEGFAGSLIGSSLAGALIIDLTFHHAWWKGVVFGLAIAVVATLGDLGESMIKRDLALKDMGKLLPGHGGIMDRLDSLLPCAPVAYLLIAVFLKT
jgi:phosphatidate cytidylyltransferase